MRILITGSTGFLGGSVGRFAASAGHEVIGIARRSQADAGWRGKHIQADVATADLAGVIAEMMPDAIFHGAGTASVAASIASPLDDLRAAVMTFANLLEGVRKSKTKPLVIFPSSAAVYGNPTTLPVAENAPTLPISPYGFHKLSCEMIAREYASCFGLDTLICRVFSVFGPAQRRLLVWEIFEQLRGQATSVKLQGTGKESRDYLHADDLAAAVLAFAQQKLVGKIQGYQVVNLASGVETQVAQLAEHIQAIVAPQKAIETLNLAMIGNPTRWCADVTACKEMIPHWSPMPFTTALTQCIARWQDDHH